MGLTYKVYLDGNFLKEVENLNTIIEGLVQDTQYTLQVSETDGEIESSLSDPLKFSTTIIPTTEVVLNVSEKTTLMSASFQLSASVLPENATFKSVVWTSDNESVATVSQTGEVITRGIGTANIKVETVDGITAICILTVKPSISVPTTASIASVTGSSDTIGIEANGLDSGESFGGTSPIAIDILDTVLKTNKTLIGVSSDWNTDTLSAEKTSKGTFLAINKNKSFEITIEQEI